MDSRFRGNDEPRYNVRVFNCRFNIDIPSLMHPVTGTLPAAKH